MAEQLTAGIPGTEIRYQDLQVHFRADGRFVLTAAYVQYGFISVNDLEMVGTLSAEDCKPLLYVESLEPRNLVTVLIPTLANQTLAQYSEGYCVEEVRVTEGQMELVVK